MRRRLVLPLVAAALGVAALIVWLGVGGRRDAQASDDVITVTPRTFTATVVAVGAVKPQIGAEVRVGSRVSGRVWRLRANIGDRVEKGTVLGRLRQGEQEERGARSVLREPVGRRGRVHYRQPGRRRHSQRRLIGPETETRANIIRSLRYSEFSVAMTLQMSLAANAFPHR